MTKVTPFQPTTKSAGWVPPSNIQNYKDRFEGRVLQPEDKHYWDATNDWHAQCWMWIGPVRADGQAFIHCHSQPIPIHRFAWLLWVGAVPQEQFPRPIACGVKLCVAPHHLQLTTRRGQIGRKLSRGEEGTIRYLRLDPDNAGSGWTIQRLADKFEVSASTISRVLKELDA